MQKKITLSDSTAWYTIGNIFIRSISFILLPFYSNYIHPYNFGQYALILSAYVIVSVFYQFGMQNSLFKFYIEERDNSQKRIVFSSVFTFILILSSLITLFICFYSDKFSELLLGSVQESVLIRMASIALFFDTLNFFFLQLLKSEEESKKVVFYSAVSAVINLFLNIYFIYGLKMSVKGILTAQMLSNIALFVMMFWDIKEGLSFKIDRALLKKILRFSFPFLVGGIFTVGVNVVDRFFLDYYMGEEKVGIYSFAYRIAMVMNIFVVSLASAWTPYSIRRYNEGNYYEDFGKSFTKILAFSLLLFIIVSLLVGDLFSFRIGNGFLFDHKYYSGLTIIPVVLIGYLFNVLVSYFSLYPFVSGKSYHFVYSDGLAFAANIGCNFLLIPFFGIMGAAIATLVSFAISFIYLVRISSKHIKIKFEAQKIAGILFITGIIYISSFIANKFIFDLFLIGITIFLFYKISGIHIKFLKELR